MAKHLVERRKRARAWGRENIPRKYASPLGLPTTEPVPPIGWPPGEGPKALQVKIARQLGLYRCKKGGHYVKPKVWRPRGKRAKHPGVTFRVCPFCMNGSLPVKIRYTRSKLPEAWRRYRRKKNAKEPAPE